MHISQPTFMNKFAMTVNRPLLPLAQGDTGGRCRFVTGHWSRIWAERPLNKREGGRLPLLERDAEPRAMHIMLMRLRYAPPAGATGASSGQLWTRFFRHITLEGERNPEYHTS